MHSLLIIALLLITSHTSSFHLLTPRSICSFNVINANSKLFKSRQSTIIPSQQEIFNDLVISEMRAEAHDLYKALPPGLRSFPARQASKKKSSGVDDDVIDEFVSKRMKDIEEFAARKVLPDLFQEVARPDALHHKNPLAVVLEERMRVKRERIRKQVEMKRGKVAKKEKEKENRRKLRQQEEEQTQRLEMWEMKQQEFDIQQQLKINKQQQIEVQQQHEQQQQELELKQQQEQQQQQELELQLLQQVHQQKQFPAPSESYAHLSQTLESTSEKGLDGLLYKRDSVTSSSKTCPKSLTTILYVIRDPVRDVYSAKAKTKEVDYEKGITNPPYVVSYSTDLKSVEMRDAFDFKWAKNCPFVWCEEGEEGGVDVVDSRGFCEDVI